jgi:hypothetical protein
MAFSELSTFISGANMIRFAVVAGVVLGSSLSPLFVRSVPVQPASLQLVAVPHVPVEDYRPIRRVAKDGNLLAGDEIDWGGVLPVFRDQ